ncbi:MAG: family 16 glycosylhydrolase [Abitibacteriaceae bacterium]|nr:family 16 glycosylhydrolase [Abditibacteriaceae bacterium]MBV9864576.1 family 16 glycosylhydrolase [Abditibacteriaceae bacterium]
MRSGCRVVTTALLALSSISLTKPLLAQQSIKSLPPAPVGYRWQAIPELSDEFNGTDLDKTKWLPYQPYWKGREPSHFDPQNVFVHNGQLELRSTTTIEDLAVIKNPDKDVWVSAACVASKSPIATYGYYETRMKASKLSVTSSFWFQGKYSEIDVVEQVGASLKQPTQGQYMLMNTHSFKGGWKNDQTTPNRWKMPTGAADDYHVYGVWWKDKDSVWFYHNGEKVAAVKLPYEYLEPMYLFFDTEVFSWEGLPTVEALKDPERNTMHVDWVHGWKLVPIQQK